MGSVDTAALGPQLTEAATHRPAESIGEAAMRPRRSGSSGRSEGLDRIDEMAAAKPNFFGSCQAVGSWAILHVALPALLPAPKSN